MIQEFDMDEAERDEMVEGWLRNIKEPDPVKFPEEHKSWTWLQKLSALKQVRDEILRRDGIRDLPGGEETIRRGEEVYNELVDKIADSLERGRNMEKQLEPEIEQRRIADVIRRHFSKEPETVKDKYLDLHRN